MSNIKLYYFPLRARAEPMRMAFALSGKKYDNIVIPFDKWPEHKKNAPYNQLPYIEVNGKTYGESMAIAGYIARECGLAGKTSEDAMRVMEVYSLATEILMGMAKANFEKDETRKAELTKKFMEEIIPNNLGFFEKLLKENGSTGYFLPGNALSFAELAAYDITVSVLKKKPDALSSFPLVQKMRSRVEDNPNMKAYLASRPQTDV